MSSRCRARSAWLLPVMGVACALAGGCATVVHGSRQNIDFDSTPPGAIITLDDGKTYTTPSQIRLERRRDYLITISKDGFQPLIVPVESVPSAFVAGNAVFGLLGVAAAGLDVVGGGAWSLCPDNVKVVLQPLAPGQSPLPVPTGEMSIEGRLKAVERLHDQGVLDDAQFEAVRKKLLRDQARTKAREEARSRDPSS